MRDLTQTSNGALVFQAERELERIQIVRVYHEGGTVMLGINDDMLQYLTPIEAMAFSKAFKRVAIAALEYEP